MSGITWEYDGFTVTWIHDGQHGYCSIKGNGVDYTEQVDEPTRDCEHTIAGHAVGYESPMFNRAYAALILLDENGEEIEVEKRAI